MSTDLKSKFHQNNLNEVKPLDSTVYGFEDYRLDVGHLMLYHGGEEVSLTPKQVETLLALIEQRGEIVSKDALMDRLWGDAAVEESNLIQNIYILRKVLGETRDGQPMIETLRRRGYRFNAELSDHKHRTPEVSAQLRLSELESLALLPANDELPYGRQTDAAGKTGDKTKESIEKVETVRSAERPYFGRFRGLIAYLGIAAVLFAGVALYLTLSGSNILGIGDSSRIVSESTEVRSKRGTNNEEAYQLYFQAMNLSEERGVQNVLKSHEYLERAVALDPNYALAWAAKAHIDGVMAVYTGRDVHEHHMRSMKAIGTALAIDPNLSEAYSARCHNKNRYEYDVAGAEADCKHALDLDPNSATAHKVYANFLYSRGRFDEAIAEIKRAMELQPVSYRNQQMYALTLYYARRYVEAEEQFKRLVELNPNHLSYIYGRLIRVLEQQGKEREAFEYLVKMLTIQKEDGKLERLKTAYAKSGWRGVTMERIRMPGVDPVSGPFELACLHAKIGDKDAAFEYLEKAYQERSYRIAMLHVEPELDPLRHDERFADLVRRVERK